MPKDEIAQGYRLACQAEPLSDVKLDIPRESLPVAQQMQIDGREVRAGDWTRPCSRIDLSLPAPDLHDLRSDLTRVQAALAKPCRSAPRLQRPRSCAAAWRASPFIPTPARSMIGRVRLAVRPQDGFLELAGVLPPGTPLLGMAADMGSTKLAIYLVDLASGVTLAKTGVMNPQIAYGEDVVSRIAFANRSEENRLLLQTRLAETFNQVIAELCQQAGNGCAVYSPDQVVDAVVVGNTAMHHFFTALPVNQLGASPYVPAVSEPLDVPAAELGLQPGPGRAVYLPGQYRRVRGRRPYRLPAGGPELPARCQPDAGRHRHQHRDQPGVGPRARAQQRAACPDLFLLVRFRPGL